MVGFPEGARRFVERPASASSGCEAIDVLARALKVISGIVYSTVHAIECSTKVSEVHLLGEVDVAFLSSHRSDSGQLRNVKKCLTRPFSRLVCLRAAGTGR